MYSANDLYNMTPENVNKDIGDLKGCYYDHLPEIQESLWSVHSKNEKVEIKVLKNFCFDGRRIWSLKTVWYDGKPVMIVQNAGREGDDHRYRYITDKASFNLMVDYLKSLFPPSFDSGEGELISPDEKLEDLYTFYGNDLFGTFEKY